MSGRTRITRIRRRYIILTADCRSRGTARHPTTLAETQCLKNNSEMMQPNPQWNSRGRIDVKSLEITVPQKKGKMRVVG
ncbi:hypothetical protein HNY73_001741 [Argiope bruennichi]|uniref:Uncharacterized protein n=1 Tax=Argiope bruennichi TaxID=94029 RepID=A0A8T0FRG5_ARGBR|nr:hypothetical protein HNY73_001741 [Argiope bruennichi]